MPKTPKKFALKKRTPFNPDFLPIMQNLRAEGRSLADIALMIGFSGKNPKQWMQWLKNTKEGVTEALDSGTNMADCKLVATAFDVATGYDVEETEITYINNPKINDIDGKVTARYIEKGRKVKTKHIKPDPGLLFRMICNRMPDDFNDTQKIDVTKRSIDAKIIAIDEVGEFAGKLYDAAKRRRIVESREIKLDKHEEVV